MQDIIGFASIFFAILLFIKAIFSDDKEKLVYIFIIFLFLVVSFGGGYKIEFIKSLILYFSFIFIGSSLIKSNKTNKKNLDFNSKHNYIIFLYLIISIFTIIFAYLKVSNFIRDKTNIASNKILEKAIDINKYDVKNANKNIVSSKKYDFIQESPKFIIMIFFALILLLNKRSFSGYKQDG